MEKINKKVQHEKEFNSFKKKFDGRNLIWFLSLKPKYQLDLFYEWKQYKFSKKNITSVVVNKKRVYNYFTGSWEIKTIKTYPASFKHFILRKRSTKKYFVHISKIRDMSLKILMENS